MPSQFGGIAVEGSQFGGVPVEEPISKFGGTPVDSPKEDEDTWLPSKKQIGEEGFLGRVAVALGKKVGLQPQYVESKPEVSKGPTLGVMDSIKAIGTEAVEHPGKVARAITRGVIEDPELLLPGLWEGMPVKVAASLAKMGLAAKVAETGVRGALIGGTLDAAAQEAQTGKIDWGQVESTSAQFGAMGVGGKLVGAGLKKVSKVVKDNVILPTKEVKPTDSKFAESRIKKDESVGEGIKRNRDRRDAEFASKDADSIHKDAVTMAYNQAKSAAWKYKQDFIDNIQGDVSAMTPTDLAKHRLTLGDDHWKEIKRGSDAVYKSTYEGSLPKHEETLISKQEGIKRRIANENVVAEKLGVTPATIHELLPTDEAHAAYVEAEEQASKAGMPAVEAHLEALQSVKDHPSLSDKQVEHIDSQLAIMEEEKVSPTTKEANDILGMSPHEAILHTVNSIHADERGAENRAKFIVAGVEEPEVRSRITAFLDNPNERTKIRTDVEREAQKVELERSVSKYAREIAEAEAPVVVEDRFDPGTNVSITEANRVRHEHLNDIKHTLEEKRVAALKRLETLMNEPPEMHALPFVESIKSRLEELRDLALKHGVLETYLENYVPRILDWSGFKGTESERMSIQQRIGHDPAEPRIKQDSTISRKFETRADLRAYLEGTGITLENDIAVIMEKYEKQILTAIAHKKLVDYSKVTLDMNGAPLIKTIGEKIHGDKFESFEAVGTGPLADLIVNPNYKRILEHVFRQEDPGMVARGLSATTMAVKSANVGASAFHLTTLGVAHLVLRPSSILHPVDTIRSMNIAVDMFKNGVNKDVIDMLIRHGGLIVGTDDVHLTAIGELGKGVDKYISKIGGEVKLAQHLTEPVEKYIIQPLNHATWEVMHTGSKLHVAMTLLTDMIAAHPEIDPHILAREISAHVNTVFGGLNWTEIAAHTNKRLLEMGAIKNPMLRVAGKVGMTVLDYAATKVGRIQGRERMQWLMFAPDWTVSAFRSVTDALPHSFDLKEGVKGFLSPKNRADLARRYVTNAAITYLTVLNGVNMAFNNGKPIWENDDPTKISLGDGRSIQVAKHMMEFVQWIREPLTTGGNKLAFWPRATSTLLMGRTNPLSIKSTVRGEDWYSRPLEVAKSALPFQIASAIKAPTGEKAVESLSSMLGAPITGSRDKAHTPGELKHEKSVKRRERKIARQLKKREEQE